MTEKKVHRCVQAGIHPDEDNHAQVSCHGDKVKKKEEQEEEAVHVLMILKPCENKLCENRDGQKALKKKKDHKELDKSKSPTNINN